MASAGDSVGAAAVAGAEGVRLVEYEDERQLSDIMSLVDRDLSEPYSIFTYRYFLHNWPGLCFVVRGRQPHGQYNVLRIPWVYGASVSCHP